MTGKEIQDHFMGRLAKFVGKENLRHEWSVKKDAKDTFSEKTYAPRLDIAIGPFNPTFENRHRDAIAILKARSPLTYV